MVLSTPVHKLNTPGPVKQLLQVIPLMVEIVSIPTACVAAMQHEVAAELCDYILD